MKFIYSQNGWEVFECGLVCLVFPLGGLGGNGIIFESEADARFFTTEEICN